MDPVTVFVNLPTGSTPEFSLSTDATVLDIKLRVQDAMGPTPIGMLDTYTLHTTRGATDGSLLLNNALSLADAGIENESSVIFNRVGALVRRYYMLVSLALSHKALRFFLVGIHVRFWCCREPHRSLCPLLSCVRQRRARRDSNGMLWTAALPIVHTQV